MSAEDPASCRLRRPRHHVTVQQLVHFLRPPSELITVKLRAPATASGATVTETVIRPQFTSVTAAVTPVPETMTLAPGCRLLPRTS